MAETNGAECHRAVGLVRAGGNYHIIFIGHNEVELARLQIAAGQTLGGFGDNLDISARRCRVGVYKLCAANGFAVQRINGGVCHKLTFAVIFDGESDLVCTGIIPDAAEVVIYLADDIGLFAYVGRRESRQVKRNVAVFVVLGGKSGSSSNRLTCLFEQIKREFAPVQCAVADHDIQFLGGLQSYINVVGVIDVGEFCDVSAFGSIRETVLAVASIILGFAFQHAVVVPDIYHNLILGFVVGDARNTADVLGNEVSVCTCGLEFQQLIAADGGSLIQVVDGSGGTGRHGGIAIMAQGKVEGIRAVPWAALQLFFDLEEFFGFRRVRFCVVGVYKLGFGFAVYGFVIAVFNLGLQVVGVGIQRNLDGGGNILGGLGHAGNISVIFRNGVGVSTRLVVGDFTEIGGRCAVLCRCGFAALGGHRGTFIRLKGKGELVTLFPVTAGNGLAYAQRGLDFTCKGVGEVHFAYWCPVRVMQILLKVGGRDGQRIRTHGRNHSLNQILFLAVSDICLRISLFGKQVIIGLVCVFFPRVGDRCKGNITIRIVDGARHIAYRIARQGDVCVVIQRLFVFVFLCGFEIEVELTVGQVHRFAFRIFVEFLGLNNKRLGVIFKGVGKRDFLHIRGYVISTCFLNSSAFHFQLAAAIVLNSNGHTVEGAVIRNTCNLILVIGGDNLGDVVHILTGFIEGDPSEVKVGSRSVVASLTRHYALGIAFAISLGGQRGAIGDSLQLEGKFIGCLPLTALQNLFALERVTAVIRVHGNRGGVIGVCHRDFFGCTCRDRALAVVRDATGIVGGRGFFRDGIGAACGQAYNLGSLVFFQGESIAALDGFSTLNTGNGVVVAGIGVQARARQLKLHRKFGVSFRVQTLGGYHILGNFQAASGVHGQLTVVAKVQHTLVCVKIPLEVNAALRGSGCVVFLIAQLVINGRGQAAFFGARLDVAVAILIRSYAPRDGTFLINVHGNHIFLDKRIITVVRVLMQVVQLIVIGCALHKVGNRLICNGFAINNFGVQQGILGMIVEVIACCRGKGGSGRADGCFAVCRCIVFIKFVGVEADFAAFGVFGNVVGKVGVGNAAGRNLVVCIFIKADRVDDADGLGVVDFQLRGAIGVCGLIIPQGQHTGRDLDLHAVADTAAAMGDGDNDVAQIGCIGVGTADRVVMRTRKGIGIHIADGFFARPRKDLVGKGNGLKALDFHIIAQGIIESHVAVCFGFVRNMRGACRCGRYRREDVRKDILQPFSAGSRHIVICIGRFGAEVPAPITVPPK